MADPTLEDVPLAAGEDVTSQRFDSKPPRSPGPVPIRDEPTGEIVKLGSVDAYVRTPPGYPHAKSRLLVLFTGGDGYRATNNQILADRIASDGFVVVVPDQFSGEPIPRIAPEELISSFSIDNIIAPLKGISKSIQLDSWVAYHTPERISPRVEEALNQAIGMFPDAVDPSHQPPLIPGIGIFIGARNLACFSGKLEERAHNPVDTAPPPFFLRRLALVCPSLLMSSSLQSMHETAVLRIVSRHGDPILCDTPAPQADPYARPEDADPERGTVGEEGEREANESLPAFTMLRARGVEVDLSLYNQNLPSGVIFGYDPDVNVSRINNTNPRADAERKAGDRALNEVLALVKKV